MKYLVTAEQMKQYDQNTIRYFGIPSLVLMERAALAVCEQVLLHSDEGQQILIVCGSGNNGGDGFAVARLLMQKKRIPIIWFLGKESSLTDSARRQKEICEKYNLKIVSKQPDTEYTVIVDALLGVGSNRMLSLEWQKIIALLNQKEAFRIAVDVPTGVSADTGKLLGTAFCADLTVTFGFCKKGMLLFPATEYCGRIITEDIGITTESFLGDVPRFCCYENEDLKLLPQRQRYSNKGTYGKVVVAAGSSNVYGAMYLSAEAAYRMGCGLVKVFTHKNHANLIRQQVPEALVSVWDENSLSAEMIREAVQFGNVVLIGPGLGTGDAALAILKECLSSCRGQLVLDADALNLLSLYPELWENVPQNTILTPHIQEMSRLLYKERDEILENIEEAASALAQKRQVICVLKDARTLVTDGNTYFINETGNPGMAKGGSGDILAGMIASLCAQGMEPLQAASIGVWLHGMAGDLAREKMGSAGMLARDLLTGIAGILS